MSFINKCEKYSIPIRLGFAGLGILFVVSDKGYIASAQQIGQDIPFLAYAISILVFAILAIIFVGKATWNLGRPGILLWFAEVSLILNVSMGLAAFPLEYKSGQNHLGSIVLISMGLSLLPSVVFSRGLLHQEAQQGDGSNE